MEKYLIQTKMKLMKQLETRIIICAQDLHKEKYKTLKKHKKRNKWKT